MSAPPILWSFDTPLQAEGKKPALITQIRWLIRRDMPEVLNIERAAFPYPWAEEDFLCYLRQRNCIGMVAEYNHQIVGYMIYELHRSKLHVLNFATDPEFHGHTIGTQLVEKLVDKLTQQRRQEVVLEVRETNLAAQLFFKKMGFKAMLVLHNHYDDTDEDAYVMRFSLNEDHSHEHLSFKAPHMPEPSADAWMPKNRISKYYETA